MNLKFKRLFLDDDTLNHLRTIRQERKRLGLSQAGLAAMLNIRIDRISAYELGKEYPCLLTYIDMANFFQWDIQLNPNYLFYRNYQALVRKLNLLKHKYNYTYSELGQDANLSENGIYRLLKKYPDMSISSFVAVLNVLNDEDERSKLRSKLLRS